jgi:hypothetical protein
MIRVAGRKDLQLNGEIKTTVKRNCKKMHTESSQYWTRDLEDWRLQ